MFETSVRLLTENAYSVVSPEFITPISVSADSKVSVKADAATMAETFTAQDSQVAVLADSAETLITSSALWGTSVSDPYIYEFSAADFSTVRVSASSDANNRSAGGDAGHIFVTYGGSSPNSIRNYDPSDLATVVFTTTPPSGGFTIDAGGDANQIYNIVGTTLYKNNAALDTIITSRDISSDLLSGAGVTGGADGDGSVVYVCDRNTSTDNNEFVKFDASDLTKINAKNTGADRYFSVGGDSGMVVASGWDGSAYFHHRLDPDTYTIIVDFNPAALTATYYKLGGSSELYE